MSDIRQSDAQPYATRESRRGRLEHRADSYSGPDDFHPDEGQPPILGSLLGVLVAGLLLVALITAVYFLLPNRSSVQAPKLDASVRVPLPEAPSLPDVPDAPRPPT